MNVNEICDDESSEEDEEEDDDEYDYESEQMNKKMGNHIRL